MPDYRAKLPKFLWGAALANTLNCGYPLDNVKYRPAQRPGTRRDRAPSGAEDAWTTGIDYELEADVPYIPAANTAVPLATGWDGVTGFQEFLAWWRDGNVARFYPDAAGGTFIDCYLAEDSDELEPDGTRRAHLKFRNAATRFEGY